ncbi:hypothetical protein [Methylobacter sp. YRD-M1]|uniref:hypothetical protein n=1 Tax=Methylobacter sp. YRD-M1 TaxID=2911520 RepID=UPI00227B4723|nr:hypothetical protein [Methylobacter sp. YRD-M1]WAK01857.1 hypothetical protein LZ558_18890 [Methylobacter sp. YRD-M1]
MASKNKNQNIPSNKKDNAPINEEVTTNNEFVGPIQSEETELSQLIQKEIEELEAEIKSFQDKIKENKKRIRELKGNGKDKVVTKRDRIEEWLKANPSAKLADFLKYAIEEMEMSVVYSHKLWKALKPK